MRRYVGSDVSEVLIEYGQPEQVIELPDGRRAYQFRSGGGAVFVPSSTNATAVTTGSLTTVHATTNPGGIIPTEGCLLTFIAAPSGTSWTVTEIRVPRQLVC